MGGRRREDPDKVLEKYEAYVSPRKNKRIARFRFHQRVQKEGETFDTFLKDLRLLAMDCQFDNTDDILVDAIISGARHKKVQERLLNEGQELGLPKSIQIARQFELSQQHMREMRGEDSGIASIKPRRTTHNTKTVSPYPATKHSNKKQQSPPSNSRSSQGAATTPHTGRRTENAQRWELSAHTARKRTTGKPCAEPSCRTASAVYSLGVQKTHRKPPIARTAILPRIDFISAL